VNRNVALAQASRAEVVLPARVQEALGQLVGSAKEGLLALSVAVGLGVLAELLEEEVEEVVGPKGRHNPERGAARARVGRGDARRTSGRGGAAARPERRRRCGGTACHVRTPDDQRSAARSWRSLAGRVTCAELAGQQTTGRRPATTRFSRPFFNGR
jgi:hypothetical protein